MDTSLRELQMTTSLESFTELVLRLAVATVLCAVMGYEREREGKPVGTGTRGLVGLGAALFTPVSVRGFGDGGDPSRVAAQNVTGIGFLGGGLILRQRGRVQGLTTAASLWIAAAVGMSAALEGSVWLP